MASEDAKVNEDLREYLERWSRKVKFSAEEMAEVLDDVAWILAHRYRETASVPMETWGARIMAELLISEDRKATKEHGQPDLQPWIHAIDEKRRPPVT